MSQPSAKRRPADIPDEPGYSDSGMVVETAVVVNNLDRLIAGRVNDLELLKTIAAGLKAGASQTELHSQLLLLARSSREAFEALQTSRNALVGLHRKSAGGAVAQVVDHLTGLPNRSAFEARLQETFGAFESASDTVLMLVEIGALGFIAKEADAKVANRVTRRFAAILRKTVKRTDFIARVSPQHFAILFQNVLPENAAQIALRIHEAMNARLAPGNDPLMRMLSVAIGISGRKAEDQSAADVMARAQEALASARTAPGSTIYIS